MFKPSPQSLIPTSKSPLIVITGPTASGKSGLAMELAEKYNGEIICADSRTVYRGMDIGTAKPSHEDQTKVPHHLLDIVDPNDIFTASEFKRLADEAIEDIRARNKIPFLVGGTGLYIDSVVLDYSFVPLSEQSQIDRNELDKLSADELYMLLQTRRITYHSNSNNRRHMIGALLRNGQANSRRTKPDDNTYVVSISTNIYVLESRISLRASEIFDREVIDEARILADTYGWDNESMTGNIYPILRELIEGSITKHEAKQQFILRDRQLAKRQITWIKRHEYVQNLSVHEARVYLSTILNRN